MNNSRLQDTSLFVNDQETNLTNRELRQILSFLQDQGIINLSDAHKQMQRKEKERKLKLVHPYALTNCGNLWQTYIHDESIPGKRKKVRRKYRDDLVDWLLVYYNEGEKEILRESLTLEELYREWLKFKALHVKETNISRIDRSWKSYYENTAIVKIPVSRLTTIKLDEWAHRWIKSKCLTKTEYYNMSIIMRQCLDYAVELEMIDKNPFRRVKVNGRRAFRRVHKKPPETQVFNEQEVQKICALALEDFQHNKRLQYELAPLAVIFALKTGQRPAEVCADKYQDIEGVRLHIQRMLEFETGYVVDSFKGTFDAFEERYAPLTPDAIKVIELCRQRQRERGVSDQGYIFSLTDEISSGLWESIENRMERYSQIVTGEKKSLTKARKTFISTALDAGINPDTVRRVVGHRDIQTTLNNYYFDRSSAEERAKQFAEAFDKQPIFEALESSDSKMEMSDSKSA